MKPTNPIRELFESLCEHENIIVQFNSLQDMQATKVRLHGLRKQMDDQLASIGAGSLFGNRSILFEQLTALPTLSYRIYIGHRESKTKGRFTIIAAGSGNCNENLSTNLGETENG